MYTYMYTYMYIGVSDRLHSQQLEVGSLLSLLWHNALQAGRSYK